MSGNRLRVPDRVRHMLEAAENIRSDIGSLSQEHFLIDGKTQRAVIEGIIVIGEAANKIMSLDSSIEKMNPALWQQFRDAYDMRIVLTHEYFRVDPAIVWNTVQNHLPQLVNLLLAFVAEYDAGNVPLGQ